MSMIGQFSHNIRFIEGKANICADMLSRPFDVPLGEAYLMPEHIASLGKLSAEQIASISNQISAINLDEVSLETFSAQNLEKEQQSCPDVAKHQEGKLPRFMSMADVKMKSGGPTLFCEISGGKASLQNCDR